MNRAAEAALAALAARESAVPAADAMAAKAAIAEAVAYATACVVTSGAALPAKASCEKLRFVARRSDEGVALANAAEAAARSSHPSMATGFATAVLAAAGGEATLAGAIEVAERVSAAIVAFEATTKKS